MLSFPDLFNSILVQGVLMVLAIYGIIVGATWNDIQNRNRTIRNGLVTLVVFLITAISVFAYFNGELSEKVNQLNATATALRTDAFNITATSDALGTQIFTFRVEQAAFETLEAQQSNMATPTATP